MPTRKEIRDAVGLALDQSRWAAQATPEFVRLRSWSHAIDADFFPVFGVSVTGQLTSENDKEDYKRQIEIVVAWKRQGSDGVEDVIDADADEIETIVMSVLRGCTFDAVPGELQMRNEAGDGGRRIGIGVSTFTCVIHDDIYK